MAYSSSSSNPSSNPVIPDALFDLLFENSKTRKPFEEYSQEDRNALMEHKFWNMYPDSIPEKYYTASFLDYLSQFKEFKNYFTYWRCSLIGYYFGEKNDKEGIEFIRRYITDDTIFYQVAISQKNMELIRWLNENGYHRLYQRNYTDSQDVIYSLRSIQCVEMAIQSNDIEMCEYLYSHELIRMRGRDAYNYLRKNRTEMKRVHNEMYEYMKNLFNNR
jgi:hypothetical protein